MNILITICARGGSKGIPGKNIKLLNGKPLIAYTLEVAQQFAKKYKTDIELSSDSKEIIEIAAKFGLTTNYIRPIEMASDTAGKMEAIKHVLNYAESTHNRTYDFLLDMDVTAPLRNLNDLEAAFKQLQSNNEALNIFSVSPARRNPYFNMVEERKDGFVHVVRNDVHFLTRQSAPKVYDMNASFYIYKKKYFEEGWNVSTTPKSLAYVVPHICFDLDEAEDFVIMEILMKEKLLDFKL